MSNEAVYDPPPAPDKSTDTVMSEERRLTENSILEELLRNGDITVKEEPLITPSLVPALDINVKREPGARTPSSSHCMKIEVIDLVDDDDDDDDGGQDHDGDGMAMTSKPHHITDFFTIDLEEDSGGSISPPAFDTKVEENAEAAISPPASDATEGDAGVQHATAKQPEGRNSVMCEASVHASLRPVETNSGTSVAREPECCEPVQVDPHSKDNHTIAESNVEQEPRCLGPFVESSSIKCPKCSVVLTEYYQSLKHSCIAKHIYQEKCKRKLRCFFCEKEFATMSALKRHIRRHIQKEYVKCSACGSCLTSVFSFKAHALKHTNQWPYRCDICGQGSVSENHLEIHKTIHTNEKPWMCDVCGAMFPNELRLNGHKIVHLEKKYECDLCFAKFKERYKVKLHKKNVHSVRQKFKCENCSSAYSTKEQLKYHKELKHNEYSGGERFVCSICNKEFIRRFLFNSHMKKHMRNTENVRYTCDMCKRKFSTKDGLTKHILAHNGKQFSCNVCGMLFTQPGSVRRHMLNLHSSDR